MSGERATEPAIVRLPVVEGQPKNRRRQGEKRGNSTDRLRRRLWLLATFGDGTTAPCYRCAVSLDINTLTVDRIVPGIEGGTYRRNNIRPACSPCQSETGGLLGAERRRLGVAKPPERG